MSLKNLDWSKLPKNLGILFAVVAIVCVVGFVLFPLIAWFFQTHPSAICFFTFLISFFVGVCCAFYPKLGGAKYWFFISIGTFVCLIILGNRYSRTEYRGDKIMIKGDDGYGLANKWGFTVIPCEDDQVDIYAVKNKETNKTEIIGMSLNINREVCDGYNDEESSEYLLTKCEKILFFYSGENLIKLDTVSLYQKEFDDDIDYTKDEDKTSLYEYIESKYGKLRYDYDGNNPYYYLKTCYLRSTSPKNKGNDGYEDIGETTGIYEWPSGKSSTAEGYHLWVKSVGGENFYYASWGGYGKKHLLSKGSWTIEGKRYNAMYQEGKFKFYFNVSAWSSAGSEGSSGSSSHVVVEQSGPRQEWVPCPACGNSLRVGLCQNCNGTGEDLYYTRGYRACPTCGGFGKCNMCAGQGGHYETRF